VFVFASRRTHNSACRGESGRDGCLLMRWPGLRQGTKSDKGWCVGKLDVWTVVLILMSRKWERVGTHYKLTEKAVRAQKLLPLPKWPEWDNPPSPTYPNDVTTCSKFVLLSDCEGGSAGKNWGFCNARLFFGGVCTRWLGSGNVQDF